MASWLIKNINIRKYLKIIRHTHNSIIIRSKIVTKTMKEALRETQTLHAGCSKVEPKIFAHPPPPQTTFPGAQNSQNLISWRWSLPSSIDPVWWRSMHAISSYHGNRPTNKPTNTQDRLQYTAPLSLARSVTRKALLECISLKRLSNSNTVIPCEVVVTVGWCSTALSAQTGYIVPWVFQMFF